ncbi:hypothetical protein N7488_001381 [Penicillium malachiteum]|nr:hypothetical protein N7488_001381 [Penicillium malachiteum]
MSCALELLPNELLDQIIFYLNSEPPSIERIHQVPRHQITQSEKKDLKHLAQCSSHLLDLVRPRLFAHACLDLKDELAFQAFILNSDLARYVTSLVAITEHASLDPVDHRWWRRILRYLNPTRVTVLAPPTFIGNTLDTRIMDGHSWAFDIKLQILQLEQQSASGIPSLPDLDDCDSLLLARPWTSMTFNESSSLKAYNHYEYFLSRVPSVLGEWGSRLKPQEFPPQHLSAMLSGLTSFSYTAVFPFYNHVKLVLDILSLMPKLEVFSIQLAPNADNHVLEMEQRGSLDPNDPWTELSTSYSLIGFEVRNKQSLIEFGSRDLALEALREELALGLDTDLGDTSWAPEEPAHPILAHSLLRHPTPRVINPEHSVQESTKNDWKLDEDWDKGIQLLDSGVFRCGSIPRSLITTHLRRATPSAETNTFIIYPTNSDTFAARNLFNDLHSGPSGLSKDDAIKRLDSVQLLPVQNLLQAAQAVKQVSGSLQQIQEKYQQTQSEPGQSISIIILAVVGLDTLAEGVVRASNPARGAAVLASTLRLLTRLSRTHSDFLSVMLVNTHGLGSAYVEFDQQGSNRQNIAASEDTRSARDDGIHSIFQKPGTPLLSNLVMRTLDQGIDTHILLSDVKYTHVAEVIKDRTGTSLGKWGTWSPRR